MHHWRTPIFFVESRDRALRGYSIQAIKLCVAGKQFPVLVWRFTQFVLKSKCERTQSKRFNHLHIAYRAPDSRLGGPPVGPSGWAQSAAELDKGRRRFWPERMPTQGFIDRETSRHCLGQPEPLLGGIAGNRGDPALLRRQNTPQTLAPAPPVGRTTVSSSWSRPALAGASNLSPISLFSLTGSTFSSTYFARLP